MERCRTCQFFDRDIAASREKKSTTWGQCRRLAPMLSPHNTKPHMIEGVWPHVRDDDWCGEFKSLARRLDSELTDLMSDTLIKGLNSGLGHDETVKPMFLPVGTPRDSGNGSSGM